MKPSRTSRSRFGGRAPRTAIRAALLVLLGAALLAPPALIPARARANVAATKTKDPARNITNGIICPCSCGEILTGCTCETGKAMKAYVEREVGGGKSKDQIEAALVQQYGEVILGAPKARGFNLIVWVLPFVATAIGFAIATLVLMRWARRRTVPSGPGAPGGIGPRPGVPGDLEALRARAEEELRRLRE
jgi:cytochrome c-type biogenesis protein CcmH/NrfF